MALSRSYEFDNGPHCKGYGSVHGMGAESYGHDVITILDGEYPEPGEWARNRESSESVVVMRGRGGVAIRGVGYLELDASAPVEAQKRAVTIAPGQWFRWSTPKGEEMVISMLTQPAFDSDQYDVLSEEMVASMEADAVEYNRKEGE